jgi:hypothetical protein
VAADVAKAPEGYRASWFQFDNATGTTRPVSDTKSPTTTMEAPQGLPTAVDSFIAVDIAADTKEHAAWQKPIRTYFRRGGDAWQLVGLERVPESSGARPASATSPAR